MSRNPIPSRVPPKGGVPSKAPSERTTSSPGLSANGSDAAMDAAHPAVAKSEVVVARGATYYRTTRYIMVVLLLGMGGWFGYDGFKGWPAENTTIMGLITQLDSAKIANDRDKQESLSKNPLTHKAIHSDMDILIQKLLAFGLPLGSLSMLFWALYNSRGEYRLTGTTLSAPGHPAVRFEDILQLDKQMWDRKGIAYLYYSRASRKGRVRLDDFIYEREPMDEIYDRVTAYLAGERTDEPS